MKDPQYSRLLKITIGFILVAALLFTFLVISRAQGNRAFFIDNQTARLKTLNQLAAASMKDYFGKIELSLKTADFWLYSNPESDPRFDVDFINLVEMFEVDIAGNVDYRLVSKNGGLFYIPSKSSEPLSDVSDRRYYKVQQTPATRGFFISDPVISRVTGKWGIPISYPLESENAGISVIFAAVEVPTLERVLASYQMKQDGVIFLVRADGLVMATAPFDENLIGKSISDLVLWKDFITNINAPLYSETAEIDGVNRFIASTRIAGYPIYVVSSCSVEGVLAPWFQTLPSAAFIVATLMLLCSVLVALTHRLVKRLDSAMHEIKILSNTDSLTGLSNRRYFNDQLQQEILRMERYGGVSTLVMLDIDHFKRINDAHGHETGDGVLRTLSASLLQNIRETDRLARWGGEEFVVLFIEADLSQALPRLEAIRMGLQEIEFDKVGKVTCSFGAAEFHPGDTAAGFLDRADQLMYLSKEKGRNCITAEYEGKERTKYEKKED